MIDEVFATGEDGQVHFTEAGTLTPEDLAALQRQVRAQVLRWFAPLSPRPTAKLDLAVQTSGRLAQSLIALCLDIHLTLLVVYIGYHHDMAGPCFSTKKTSWSGSGLPEPRRAARGATAIGLPTHKSL